MEDDLRQEFEDLNDLAISQKDKMARIKGRLDMHAASLRELGVSFKTASVEARKLAKILNSDKERLRKMIESFKNQYADKL